MTIAETDSKLPDLKRWELRPPVCVRVGDLRLWRVVTTLGEARKDGGGTKSRRRRTENVRRPPFGGDDGRGEFVVVVTIIRND